MTRRMPSCRPISLGVALAGVPVSVANAFAPGLDAAGTVSRTTCVAVTTAGLSVKQPVKIGRHAASKIGPDILVRIFKLPDLQIGFGGGGSDAGDIVSHL